TITMVPAAGSLTLNGIAVTAGQVINAADIPNLVYTSLPHEHGAGYADFTFQVRDDGGTANGGVDTDPTPNTITIDVISVNDAPISANNAVTILEDNGYNFTLADFAFSDPNDHTPV